MGICLICQCCVFVCLCVSLCVCGSLTKCRWKCVQRTYALQTGPDARLHRARKCLVLPQHMPRETLFLARTQTMWPTTKLAGRSMCVNSRAGISLPVWYVLPANLRSRDLDIVWVFFVRFRMMKYLSKILYRCSKTSKEILNHIMFEMCVQLRWVLPNRQWRGYIILYAHISQEW